jgi:hypothetical protein
LVAADGESVDAAEYAADIEPVNSAEYAAHDAAL